MSTDGKQVFAAVQEWNQNDTYNLYLSDTRGIYFTLAMENVKTTRGIGGNQMLDLYEVGLTKTLCFWLNLLDNYSLTVPNDVHKNTHFHASDTPTVECVFKFVFYCAIKPKLRFFCPITLNENPVFHSLGLLIDTCDQTITEFSSFSNSVALSHEKNRKD